MFLTYGDLAKLFPKVKGIQFHELFFHTVATISDVPQLKGIYIPFEDKTGELKKAIENGAIAALWDERKEIPPYTPNHFPIFFTNDLLKGLKDMMEIYLEKINQADKLQKEGTHFLFIDEMRLKENNSTYDIAVMAEKINNVRARLQERKEGAE